MILEFINNFKRLHPQEIEDCFLCGNCYWFAQILQLRFGGQICYLPIENHFLAKIGERYYDISGEITEFSEKVYLWEEYMWQDELETQRIIKYCILQYGE